VRDDACDGVAAAVVVAEHLAEEAPDGRDGVEHPVAIDDVVFVEDVENAGFGQDVGERKPCVAREAVADRLQVGHEIAFPVRGLIGSVGPASRSSVVAKNRPESIVRLGGHRVGHWPAEIREGKQTTRRWPVRTIACASAIRPPHVRPT
jgi:hypothetical protein